MEKPVLFFIFALLSCLDGKTQGIIIQPKSGFGLTEQFMMPLKTSYLFQRKRFRDVL